MVREFYSRIDTAFRAKHVIHDFELRDVAWIARYYILTRQTNAFSLSTA